MEVRRIGKRFFHACSNGKMTGVIFCGNGDFVVGMNYVAICAAKFRGKVSVVSFCLMPTHVHFLLFGEAKDCAMFVEVFDTLMVTYLKRNYGSALAELPFELLEVMLGDGVRSVCAYILRNPTQASMPYFPFEYPWGSGPLHASESDEYLRRLEIELKDNFDRSVSRVKYFAPSALVRLLHSRYDELPGEWEVYKGVVLPQNYVDVGSDYAGFCSKKEFMFYLGKIRDDKRIDEGIEANANGGLGLGDLKSHMTKLFVSHFAGSEYKRVRDLPFEERQKLAVELHQATRGSLWLISKAACLRFDEVVEAIWR